MSGYLTVAERERLAYLRGDAEVLGLLEQIDLEADDTTPADNSDEMGTVSWCISRLADGLRVAKPLRKGQMIELAIALEDLMRNIPAVGAAEMSYRARVDHILGVQQ